jgi:hypothetical protein
MRDIVGAPTREDRMGFMDKAKKLAEQAQEKLDEAQKNLNKSDSPQGQPGQGGSVQYDEHGRPIQQETPAAATPPPAAAPTPSASDPAAPTEEAPAPPPPARKPSEGDADASPDPFKPIQ